MISDFPAGKILLLCFMLLCAVCDHRSRSVNVLVFAAAFILEVLAYLYLAVTGHEIRWSSILSGLIPGIFIGLVSAATRGSLGMGDAVYFGITGIAVGGVCNAILFAAGMLLSAGYGLILTVRKMLKGESARRVSFALLPFVLPAGVAMMVML